MNRLSTLTQDGRTVEGMRSFGPDDVSEYDDIPKCVRIGLTRYAIDDIGESTFELNMQGKRLMSFRGIVSRYEYHPATGLYAIVELRSEPEYRDLEPPQ